MNAWLLSGRRSRLIGECSARHCATTRADRQAAVSATDRRPFTDVAALLPRRAVFRYRTFWDVLGLITVIITYTHF